MTEADNVVTVKGPKGELRQVLPPFVKIRLEAGTAFVEQSSDDSRAGAMHGLARSLLSNMVVGVTEGFQRTLHIEGVGYQARIEGGNLVLQIGFCHDVVLAVPEGLDVEIPSRTKTIHIRGIDKQMVGQFAANVRRVRPPEPYKGKGIRYVDEIVRRKAGKAQVAAG
jgi:large subunit ribosomal protein L6